MDAIRSAKVRGYINSENVFGVLLFLGLLLFPLFTDSYSTLNFSNFIGTMILVLSMVLIWGYTGIFSFGQAALFGVGGYVYGIIALNLGSGAFTPLALVIAVGAGFVVALILGYFMFYGGINDVFVGLITLCVTMVFETFMAQTAGSEWKVGNVPLGGFNGINGIPMISIGSFTFGGNSYYYLVFAILLLIYIALRKVKTSKIGFTLISIRENRPRSELFGYNTNKIQMLVFAAAGAMAALSGVLYTCWGGYIVPSSMGMTNATVPVVLAAAGDKKSATATCIFTLIYLQLSQNLAASGSKYSLIILGAILLFVVLVVPNGILASLFKVLDEKLFKVKTDIEIEEGTK